MKLAKAILCVLIVSLLVSMAIPMAMAKPGGGGGKPPKDEPPADPAIAFVVHTSKVDKLMVMNADGSNQAEVYKVMGITDLYDPSWSPDGQSIAFVRGTFDLWRIDVEVVNGEPQGSNAYRLLEDAMSPEWSPAGDSILFVTCCGPGNSLQIIDTTGGNLQTLYAASAESRISAPAWSPDALRIAFVESNPEGASIKILDVGSEPVTTVPLQEPLPTGNMMRLDWARTQDELAYGAGRPGAGALYTVDIEGTLTPLIDGWTPSWSPNDSQLVFMNDRHQIAAYDLITEKTEKLARSGYYPDWCRS